MISSEAENILAVGLARRVGERQASPTAIRRLGGGVKAEGDGPGCNTIPTGPSAALLTLPHTGSSRRGLDSLCRHELLRSLAAIPAP